MITDSIIMEGAKIGKNVRMNKAIVAENVVIGDDVVLGEGTYAESKLDTRVYASDLVTISENSVIPDGVSIGLNTAISGAPRRRRLSERPSGGRRLYRKGR